MGKILHIFIMLAAVASMQSCEKELDIDYKDIEPITVIEGMLSQTGAKVRITSTTPMDEPMNTEACTDADVILADITAGTYEILSPDADGNYMGSEAGMVGHAYSLTVKRGGKIYASECTMAAPVTIDNVEFSWIKMPYDDVAGLQVIFSDNQAVAGECYWVRLYRNGEAYMWNLVTDLYSAGGTINDVFRTSRRDLDEEDEATALRKGDVVTATVAPVSRAMYDYLEAVSSDSNGPRMFAGDFCLGYFLAAPVASASVIFDI